MDRFSARLLAVVLVTLAGARPALADGPKAAPPAGPAATPPPPVTPGPAAEMPSEPAHELTAADVSAFLDGIVPQQLAREDIAGAAVAVVKGGQLLFARGYGFADVEKKTPVSADATLFRPGSVSKLFTWTAVMQLVERGQLDLDRDVNDYLDFRIPATYPKPVTLRSLLTHTPGFEEVLKDLAGERAETLRPLSLYLATHVPRRIFAPGTIPAYSNYGAALAGHIVERASGLPFETYVEREIFRPLGMTRSTFAQPLPPALAPLVSSAYFVASKPPRPFEVIQAGPAGALSATATDLARFMIAHLQDGRLGDARILKPETARLMHARQLGLVPDMNGMALGFYEESQSGRRIIGHAGDTLAFHSDLHLMVDDGVGFFVSYNSAGTGVVSPRTALWHAFLDRYLPWQPPAATKPAEATARVVEGSYLSSRRVDSTLFSLASYGGQVAVIATPDGRLSIDALRGPSGAPLSFEEVAPLRYRSTDGRSRIAFVRDASGRLVLVPDYPFMAFEKQPWYASRGMVLLVVMGSLVVLAVSVVLWPVAALARRHYGRPLALEPADRRLRLAVRLAAAGVVAVVAGWTVFVASGMRDLALFGSGSDGRVHALQVATAIVGAASLASLVYAYRSWRRPGAWLGTRILETVVALACIGFVWTVVRFHLLQYGPGF